jgi:DNA-directed RNA polymerase subunit RPC12/RpoP
MQPNEKLISIDKNPFRIKLLLRELVLRPRINAIKWSLITRQTSNIKIGYPGQHLASLITGMKGEGTGARGNDLVDGSEVKSCSRIDALDKCARCGAPVSRNEIICPECGLKDIIRNNDSKWLFGIRNENDLKTLLHSVKRIFLILGDYPKFESGDYSVLKFQSFEIWPEHPRNAHFAELMTNYYEKIYLGHKKKDASKNPAPKNFWPYSYQFYLCNPIPTFSCTIKNADIDPKISIDFYVEPEEDRSKITSPLMPARILTKSELDLMLSKASKQEIQNMLTPGATYDMLKSAGFEEKRALFVGIDETLRSYLPLRDTDKISTAKNPYARRIH